MDWQIIVTSSAIAVAGVYVILRGVRVWRGMKGGCSGGCGCAKTGEPEVKKQSAIIAPEDLVLRKRD